MAAASGVRCFTRNTPGLVLPACEELDKVLRHRPKVLSHENPTLRSGDLKHLAVTKAM